MRKSGRGGVQRPALMRRRRKHRRMPRVSPREKSDAESSSFGRIEDTKYACVS